MSSTIGAYVIIEIDNHGYPFIINSFKYYNHLREFLLNNGYVCRVTSWLKKDSKDNKEVYVSKIFINKDKILKVNL
jgi:hypothetical protein